ncbi:mechanosensitive channel of small conductance-like protein, putative [Medicago truncatula]|uniref:Mechanosensitive channel of small conductance-like protein, putative n=1 Tax=Medicago truncatula TaxID=3880 RepID=G7JG85_MEDTR|nr:mechanosensitive channel of small conductance-like protein, putative [Medicago truncatula]
MISRSATGERRALALTLNDTKTAVNKLHRMLNFLVFRQQLWWCVVVKVVVEFVI